MGVDSSLSLNAQVSALVRNVFARLKLVCQPNPFLGMSNLDTVKHDLATSYLDHCQTLCVGLPLESSET